MFRPEASSPWPGQGQGLDWLLTPRNLELGAALLCLGAPIPCLGAPLPCMMPNRNGIWPQEHLNSQHLPSRCPALPRRPLFPAVELAVRGSSQSLSHLGGSQDPSGSPVGAQWEPGSAGIPSGTGVLLPHSGAGAAPHPVTVLGAGSQEAESAPRGQEGALPSPCSLEDVVTYPYSISRLAGAAGTCCGNSGCCVSGGSSPPAHAGPRVGGTGDPTQR